jgi:protein-S-isoprenylcysteine O-methyltransferase
MSVLAAFEGFLWSNLSVLWTDPLLAGVVVLFAASEGLLAVHRHRRGAPRLSPRETSDQGTFAAISAALVAAGVGGYLIWFLNVGPLGPPEPLAFAYPLVLVGIAVRAWAILTLGPLFTYVVTVQPGHELVRRGPYRWVRHPSYTGGFLSILGVTVAGDHWLALLLVLVLVPPAFALRVRAEEHVLSERFGAEFQEYATRTWRFLPGIY